MYIMRAISVRKFAAEGQFWAEFQVDTGGIAGGNCIRSSPEKHTLS